MAFLRVVRTRKPERIVARDVGTRRLPACSGARGKLPAKRSARALPTAQRKREGMKPTYGLTSWRIFTWRIALNRKVGTTIPLTSAAPTTIRIARQPGSRWTRSGRAERSAPWTAAVRMQTRSSRVPRMTKFERMIRTRIRSADCVIVRSPGQEDHAEGRQEAGGDEELRDANQAKPCDDRLDHAYHDGQEEHPREEGDPVDQRCRGAARDDDPDEKRPQNEKLQ